MKNTITAALQKMEKEIFHQLYKDQTLLIKISGAEIENSDFNRTVWDIKALIADQINELIFITPTGGVLNKKGEIISTLSLKTIEKILQNKHSEIEAKDGMFKKLQEVQKLLQFVDKVALTGNQNSYHEITKLKGASTLCINLAKAKIEPLAEPRIFEVAYGINVQSGNWKERTDEEKAELKQHHFVLSVGGSPLGGYSLLNKPFPLDKNQQGSSFECWWAQEEGNVAGSLSIQDAIAKAQAQNLPLFCYSKQPMNHFGEFKKYPETTSSTGAPLWVKI